MFGFSNLWVIGAVLVLLAGGAVWHEKKVGDLRDEVLTQERARVALATAELQRTEALRAADNAAQSEREAAEHEDVMAQKDRALEEAERKIEELEKGSKCVVSKGTVQRLNSLR